MADSDDLVAPADAKESLDPEEVKADEIPLSNYTKALIDSVKSIKSRPTPDDLSKLSVSQTVSFVAIAYEKVRNAIEYREDHLVLRAAIERNLKRRLALNPQGEGEAENLLRELMWARYFPNESLGEDDIEKIQTILNRFLKIKAELLEGHQQKTQIYLYECLFELFTCEIEETLNAETDKRAASYTYFIFQTLREKIKVEGLPDDQKDAYFLVALDKAYRKSDRPYLRYHLFTTFYKPLSEFSESELKELIPQLPDIFKKVDSMIQSPQVDDLVKYVKRQLPPFLVLFDIFDTHRGGAEHVLKEKRTLWDVVEKTCKEKYGWVASRLRSLALRSLIYIFITKMLLALILEYPVSQYLYGEVHRLSIIINAVFPPVLMLLIVLFFKLPDEENTKKIYERIINIVDADKTFETQVAYLRKKVADKKSLRIFAFTMIYSFMFFLTLYLINIALTQLHFNIVSKALFIFFVSVVSFFSYRIKQVVNEYKLGEKEGILSPIVDFFFIPILSIGKFFSKELGRLNVFIFIFDFIIEAPFKIIIEVFEEWIKFVRARKEEIV